MQQVAKGPLVNNVLPVIDFLKTLRPGQRFNIQAPCQCALYALLDTQYLDPCAIGLRNYNVLDSEGTVVVFRMPPVLNALQQHWLAAQGAFPSISVAVLLEIARDQQAGLLPSDPVEAAKLYPDDEDEVAEDHTEDE